jgi:hypothetical protein
MQIDSTASGNCSHHLPSQSEPKMQKAPVIANEGFAYLVARGGIEPPTQGFSTLFPP